MIAWLLGLFALYMVILLFDFFVYKLTGVHLMPTMYPGFLMIWKRKRHLSELSNAGDIDDLERARKWRSRSNQQQSSAYAAIRAKQAAQQQQSTALDSLGTSRKDTQKK